MPHLSYVIFDRKKYSKQYYEENKEKILQYQKQYYHTRKKKPKGKQPFVVRTGKFVLFNEKW